MREGVRPFTESEFRENFITTNWTTTDWKNLLREQGLIIPDPDPVEELLEYIECTYGVTTKVWLLDLGEEGDTQDFWSPPAQAAGGGVMLSDERLEEIRAVIHNGSMTAAFVAAELLAEVDRLRAEVFQQKHMVRVSFLWHRTADEKPPEGVVVVGAASGPEDDLDLPPWAVEMAKLEDGEWRWYDFEHDEWGYSDFSHWAYLPEEE